MQIKHQGEQNMKDFTNGGLIEIEQGYVDWSVYSDPVFDDEGNESTGDEYVKIDNLFVKPEFRGHGYARKMLEQAIEMIQKQTPDMEIKIVPEPKDDTTDYTRLVDFYSSFSALTVVA
jgi:ribosomal protein S18 acetylase RimI-like enzyme